MQAYRSCFEKIIGSGSPKMKTPLHAKANGVKLKNKCFVTERSKTETFSSIKKYYLRIRM